MPLTSNLLQAVHAVASSKSWYLDGGRPSPNGQADWLVDQLNWYFPLHNINHHAIVSGELSGFDIEKFLSYVAASSAFVHKTGERWSEHGDKFVTFLKAWIAEAILTHQHSALRVITDDYARFAESLSNSLILSFNWDTILETTLDAKGLQYAFDLQSTYKNGRIPLIKLHGSIDWFSMPSEYEKKDWMSFQQLSESFEGCFRASGELLWYYNHGLTPWIIIPSYDKISQILALGDFWQTPWMFLQDDLEVIVIGFSMRHDDFHSRAFLYPQLVHGSRKGSLVVKVIDLASSETDKQNIRDRFSGVENCQFFFDGFGESALDFIEAA